MVYKQNNFVNSPFGIAKIVEIYPAVNRVGLITKDDTSTRFCSIDEISPYKQDSVISETHAKGDYLTKYLKAKGLTSICDAVEHERERLRVKPKV